jgi:hypothetical protein
MKHPAHVALVAVMLTSDSFAADPKPLTHSGAKALLFDLGGLANLAAGNYGGGLGFKYYIASDLAVRLSLGFSTSTQTSKNAQTPLRFRNLEPAAFPERRDFQSCTRTDVDSHHSHPTTL